MMRVMRFGTFVPQGWRFDLVGIEPDQQWDTMLGLAKRADDNPDWESIWVYDHFHTTPEPSEEATHEAWSLMAAFGAATSRVRLGQMCTCMAYRNPAYLAKVAATIDVISGGRVEMGIGGGWYEHEWRAYGYGFPPAGERLGRLREGVEIFRQMWTKGIATHAGKYYTVDGAIGQPRPLQGTTLPGSAANGIPMWVAGGGEKVTLQIAAEYADYTNFDGRRRRGSPPRARSSRSTARTSGATSARSCAPPTTTSSSARPRRTSRTGWPGSRTPTARPGCPTRRSARRRRTSAAVPPSARPSRSSRRCRASRSRG